MSEASPQYSVCDLKKRAIRRDKESQPGKIPPPRFPWGTRVLIPAGVLAGFLCLFLVSSYQELFPAVAVRVAPVVVKRVSGPMAGTVTVQAAGWVEADPYTSYVAALADGIVREILVLEGQRVETGQVVARLVDDDARLALQRTEAEAREREAALESARATLEAAKADWDNPVERTHLVSVAEAELREAEASLKQVLAEWEVEQAVLEKAKSDYERSVPLQKSASISEAEFIRQRATFDAQTAKVKALEERRSVTEARIAKHYADLLKANEHMRLRTEDRRKLHGAQAACKEAQAALARAKIACDEARLRLNRMEVRSPASGIVMKRLASPGSKLLMSVDEKHSSHMLTLYDPDRLQVRVDVPLADAGKIGTGQPANIVVEVLPERIFTGTVTRVLHEANIQKNTLEVKVAIDKPDPQLRPEMLARVKFLAKQETNEEQAREALFGPEAVFRRNGSTATAWVVRDRHGTVGRAYSKSVELGGQTEGWVEVSKGLQPGDLLIVHTPSELADGARVRVAGES